MHSYILHVCAPMGACSFVHIGSVSKVETEDKAWRRLISTRYNLPRGGGEVCSWCLISVGMCARGGLSAFNRARNSHIFPPPSMQVPLAEEKLSHVPLSCTKTHTQVHHSRPRTGRKWSKSDPLMELFPRLIKVLIKTNEVHVWVSELGWQALVLVWFIVCEYYEIQKD